MIHKWRVGLGHIIYPFDLGASVPMKATVPLCGFPVESAYPVRGKADNDVALHAVVDALLGASALGDIGSRYPNYNCPEGLGSEYFVADCIVTIRALGFMVVNIDLLVCAVPMVLSISKHRQPIRENLARMLEIDVSCVNIKAKSMNGLSCDTGSGRAVSAQVITLLGKV